MKLITAHRILISAAIAFFLFYAVAALVHGRPGALVHAAVALVVAVGLLVYYRSLRSRWRRPPVDRGGPRNGPPHRPRST